MPEPSRATPTRRPNAAIDVLKGLAILGVLWQHAVPPTITDSILGNLWIRPAVPIFLLLLGFNMARSLTRDGAVHLTRPFLAAYAQRRLARIAVPFLVVLAIGYAIAVVTGELDFGPALLVGALPVNAPGNYYLTALIGFIVVLPLMVWADQRWPVATLLTCIALNIAYEAFAYWAATNGHAGLGPANYLYQSNPLRWLGLVALGVWVARDPRLGAPRNRLLLAFAVPSAVYLVMLQLDPGRFPFIPAGFLGMTNLLAAPWALLLLLAGLRWLPSETPATRTGRGLVGVGRASYHVYLVQILWMGWIVDHIWAGIADDVALRAAVSPLDFAVCIAVGWLYFRVLPGTRLQLPGRLGGRRPAPEPS